MTDRLEQLLRDADAEVAQAMATGDLVERVHGVSRARRKRNRFVGAAAVILLVAAGAIAWLPREQKPGEVAMVQREATQPEDIAAARVELSAIEEEVLWRSELAAKLWQRERERQRTLVLRRKPLATGHSVEGEVDRAAFAMVYQADRMAREMQLPEAAAQVYRQVSSDFPRTPSAAVAKQRLAAMNLQKDG
jgi:hypothetical protein